ncbi:unnamed protein product [Rangifer tarandus platyrhynchus]|uniref:Uncharacterized protein n=1 Tax=Rangifer tarandus platyrhynchus TaxID=3082113 RepID=A0ABN8Z9K4_RANTA|nr:unnamed protein product [Rangifer tarandus platyrhynchus]
MSSEESVSLDHISSEYSVLFFSHSTLTHLPTEHRNVTFGYIKAVTRLLGLQESLCSAERTMNYMIRYAPVVVVLAQLCLTLCDPMDYGTPDFLVLHYFPELAQTHVHQVSDAIKPSHPVAHFSSCPQSVSPSGSFPISWLFTSGDQSIGVSASAAVLPMNIQGLFPLELTG